MSSDDPTAPPHDRVMEILGEAMELPEADRAAFLERACATEPGVRAEVQRLLGQQRLADRAIGTMSAQAMLHRLQHAPQPPQSIGPYRVIQTLGEGGMGVVYLAEQTEPVRRLVALKLIRAGLLGESVIARFESERQSLALMSHPNVAKVFDAGTSSDGRPYFVMEYVPGEPITRYADAQHLSVTDRLELFALVCDAVQHAHQKGVIHRDIKPSNVLVTLQDGKPAPKVIDFGVAKAVEPGTNGDATVFTMHGQIVGTPEYMSPEQAALNSGDVDTRTDVYSLGVLLYELLSGALPFESTELRRAGAEEMRRIIRESDPPRLATRLMSKAGGAAEVARQRRASNPTSLARALRGDLEWITMKALEKDRARRYGSAAELAQDVRRHLANEPVSAGPPSQLYRLRKFVRRHRLSVAASVLVAISIAAGTALATWQAIRATRAEARAIEQKQRAEQLFNNVRELAGSFMSDVDEALQTAGPTKAREMLTTTSLEYLNKLSSQSGDDPSILRDLVRGYQRVGYVQNYPGHAGLGDPKAALENFQKARALAVRRLKLMPEVDEAATDLLAMSINCADGQRALEDHEAAIRTFDECIAMAEELRRTRPKLWVVARNQALAHDHKSNALRGLKRDEEAMKEMRTAMELRLSLFKDHADDERLTRDIAISYEGIGSLLSDTGRNEEALAEYAKAMEVQRAWLKKHPDNPIYRRDVALMLNKIADAHANLHHATESRDAISEAVREWEKLLEEDPSNARARKDLADGVKRLADSLMLSKEYEAAAVQFQRCLEMRQQLCNESPASIDAMQNLAATHVAIAEAQRQLNRGDDALGSIERAKSVYSKLGDNRNRIDERNLALAYLLAGQIHSKSSNPKSAVEACEQAFASLERQLQDDRPTRFALHVGGDALFGAAEALETLGETTRSIERYERAKQTLERLTPLDDATSKQINSIDDKLVALRSPATRPSQKDRKP